MLVFVRDDSPVIRNQLLPVTESELRQGRHILADILGLQAIVQNKGTL